MPLFRNPLASPSATTCSRFSEYRGALMRPPLPRPYFHYSTDFPNSAIRQPSVQLIHVKLHFMYETIGKMPPSAHCSDIVNRCGKGIRNAPGWRHPVESSTAATSLLFLFVVLLWQCGRCDLAARMGTGLIRLQTTCSGLHCCGKSGSFSAYYSSRGVKCEC